MKIKLLKAMLKFSLNLILVFKVLGNCRKFTFLFVLFVMTSFYLLVFKIVT